MMQLLSAVFIDGNILSRVLLVYGPMVKMGILRRSMAGSLELE
jgi:hypothetical protein